MGWKCGKEGSGVEIPNSAMGRMCEFFIDRLDGARELDQLLGLI
jgi:hypothetical protein